MADPRAALAARSNASWCDAVCRAHGRPGHFDDLWWESRSPAPPFYPNGITLRDDVAPDAYAPRVAALAESGLPEGWGVKDSFAALDLAPQGFQVGFDAEWIFAAPGALRLPPAAPGLRCVRAADPARLAAFEAAWGLAAGGASLGPTRRVFPPVLLDEPGLAFFVALRGDAIAAGLVAHHAEGAVDISNVFVRDPGDRSGVSACLAAARHAWPGAPFVGYERGETLRSAQQLGFEPVGRLRVWLKTAPSQ